MSYRRRQARSRATKLADRAQPTKAQRSSATAMLFVSSHSFCAPVPSPRSSTRTKMSGAGVAFATQPLPQVLSSTARARQQG